MFRFRTLLSLLCAIAVLQMGLLWIQGAQLHRQNQLLADLRGEVQDLAEAIDQLSEDQNGQDAEALAPMRHIHRRHRLLRVRQEPNEEDAARKGLKESKDSAQKAIQEAQRAQQKLSITEAAKRAEEQEKLHAAERAWIKWAWGALGVVVLALLLRAWWRNRS